MFIPATIEEIQSLGWDKLDVVLVTGDAYLDSPGNGVSVIGHMLIDAGFRVGIISQPHMQSDSDITRLGEPLLFWGVTSGSVDSEISNFTASGKRRKRDDLTPGGMNTRRPNRAVIAYSNLIRQYYKNTASIVIGGIEASLRRIAHYDFRDNAIRRSILFDAKADILVYGMGERQVIELACALRDKEDYRNIRGICYRSDGIPDDSKEIPPFEKVVSDPHKFQEMFLAFYKNNDFRKSKVLIQKHGDKYLVQNPPAQSLSMEELDSIFGLPYERDVHPLHNEEGKVKALETVQFSVTTHRGCFGGCHFCSINIHQGREVISRSNVSIVNEIESMTEHIRFKGIIPDLGGPTANMYGMKCRKKGGGMCIDKACVFPEVCSSLDVSHEKLLALLKKVRAIKKIRKIFVASGMRHDLVMHDAEDGEAYLEDVVRYHVSGQLKLAPEHSESNVLKCMGKPDTSSLLAFKKLFEKLNRKSEKKQFLTYYFIAAHPGSTMEHMKALKKFISKKLHITPEQVQVFTPSPSTLSTLMYHTCLDPFSGEKIFVEKNKGAREKQKRIITNKI
ncbi:YgiQ family radical SAM protein [Spirochaetota bacterium]